MNSTTMVHTPFIAGNWRMNLNHLEVISVVQKLAFALSGEYYDKADVTTIPPFTDLRSAQTLIEGDRFGVTYGAQGTSVHKSSAYTGEISASTLGKFGYIWVVVGHSKRCGIHAEDDELVTKKAKVALRKGMNPVACVGEPSEVREVEEHVGYVASQVKGSLANLTNAELAETAIAYEPVWVTGTGEVTLAADTQEVCAAIHETIAEIVDESITKEVRILYDGSAKAENATEIVDKPDVDDGLVGGASPDDEAFAKFCVLAADAAQNA